MRTGTVVAWPSARGRAAWAATSDLDDGKVYVFLKGTYGEASESSPVKKQVVATTASKEEQLVRHFRRYNTNQGRQVLF